MASTSHDMEKEVEVVFRHTPAPAYLAIVDLNEYQFFVAEGLEYHQMLAHLGRQRSKMTAVAWGCPEKELCIRLIFTRDHLAFQSIKTYSSAFQGWIKTQGRLCFTSHGGLYHCAIDEQGSLAEEMTSPIDTYVSRELLVPAGMYSIIVYRHFPWFEGDQDAPLLGEGIHFTVILRCYDFNRPLNLHPQPCSVPWS